MGDRPPFSALLRELAAAHAHWATVKLQQAAQRLDNATWTLRHRANRIACPHRHIAYDGRGRPQCGACGQYDVKKKP